MQNQWKLPVKIKKKKSSSFDNEVLSAYAKEASQV